MDRLDFDTAVAQLAEVGRAAVEQGLVVASGGNLSARLDDGTVVVTARGTWLDRLKPQDFVVLTADGARVAGADAPSSEWKLHTRAYAVRSDVNAVVHVHPQHTVLLDALGHQVRLFTLDHAYYVRSIGRTPYFPNGSDALADSAAAEAADHNCIIMGNHGCSALGETIEMAFRRALNLEEAAIATYRALTLGDRSTAMSEASVRQLFHA